MSKFKEKELLECFDAMWESATIGDTWKLNEEMQQAYQQIRETIQKEAERDEIEASYIDIAIDLYDQIEQKKPQVTEEFLDRWMDTLSFSAIPLKSGQINISGDDLIRMLKEVGVEVAEK